MDMPIMPTGDELLEKGKTTASNAVQTSVSDVANTVQNQLLTRREPQPQTPVQHSQQSQPTQPSSESSSNLSQNNRDRQLTREMVEDIYSPSDNTPRVNQINSDEAQTQQGLVEVRQRLFQEQHNEVYYNEIANAGVSKQQEERPAEKVQRQQMEEIQNKDEKKQQEVPISVLRAQTHTETSPGTVG